MLKKCFSNEIFYSKYHFSLQMLQNCTLFFERVILFILYICKRQDILFHVYLRWILLTATHEKRCAQRNTQCTQEQLESAESSKRTHADDDIICVLVAACCSCNDTKVCFGDTVFRRFFQLHYNSQKSSYNAYLTRDPFVFICARVHLRACLLHIG